MKHCKRKNFSFQFFSFLPGIRFTYLLKPCNKTLQNIANLCKTLQNFAKHTKTLQNIAKGKTSVSTRSIIKMCCFQFFLASDFLFSLLFSLQKHCKKILQSIGKLCKTLWNIVKDKNLNIFWFNILTFKLKWQTCCSQSLMHQLPLPSFRPCSLNPFGKIWKIQIQILKIKN